MTAQTLLLTAGYEPLRVLPWQRAITLLTLGKVEVLEEYDEEVRSTSVIIKLPAVIRLLRVFRRPKQGVRFSRINIYARDRWRCQYCKTKLPASKLTFDHVVPRSRGGKTVWENIVSACQPCNTRKGSRTPSEAGLTLAQHPVRPTWVPVTTFRFSKTSLPDAWRDYLYWAGALESDDAARALVG